MKHCIKSNTHVHFMRNIEELRKQFALDNQIIFKTKFSIGTFNGDYDGYAKRYVGYFWTKRKVEIKKPSPPGG